MQQKSHLRRVMRAKISEQNSLSRTYGSAQICTRLGEWAAGWPGALQRAAIFLAGPREPNLDDFGRELQRRGTLVYAPQILAAQHPFAAIAPDWSNVRLNGSGWREPQEYPGGGLLPALEMDVIFLPGLAFDLKGNRLGQGGGWYDRALENLPPQVLCIGVGFEFQMVETLPHESHDHTVSVLVSEQRIFYV